MSERGKFIVKRIGGAATSGFGLSLGRDIYRHSANLAGGLILAAILTGPFFGIYYSGRLLGRNYRTIAEAIKQRAKACIILLASCLVLLALGHAFDLLSYGAVWISIVFAVPFFCGFTIGALKRSVRKNEWDTNNQNLQFMEKHGLEDYPDGTVRDADGNLYRYEGRHGNTLVLFAIGRRNTRAFLELDPAGLLINWSGIKKLE